MHRINSQYVCSLSIALEPRTSFLNRLGKLFKVWFDIVPQVCARSLDFHVAFYLPGK